MQSSTLDFSVLQAVIDSCIKSIITQKNTPGKYMADLDSLIKQLEEAGHHVEVSDHVKALFDSQVKKPYLELLEKNLRDRFPAVEVISAFHIFDPKQLPTDECELYQYGGPELDCLLEQYISSPLELDSGDIHEEWKEFKAFLSISTQGKEGSTKDLAKFLLSTPERRLLFPALSRLLVRGLVQPVATADCERGFSAMNRIKTVPRNRLKTNTLEQLMFISIEGPSADRFDFGRAADMWGGLHHRRIHWQD